MTWSGNAEHFIALKNLVKAKHGALFETVTIGNKLC